MASHGLSVVASGRIWRCAAVLSLALATAGCAAWLAHGYERTYGKPVAAAYTGLAGHTTAVVVYVDPALGNDYTQAAREISRHFEVNLIKGVPTVHLVAPETVVRWQNKTLEWYKLREKDIARVFNVERLVFVEVQEYRTKDDGPDGELRGRINTTVRVFETGPDDASQFPKWEGHVGAIYPLDHGVSMMEASDDMIRRATLESYGKLLAECFFDHREVTPEIRSRNEIHN